MSGFLGRRSSVSAPIADDSVALEGWLKKRGHHFFSTVKTRYFVLLKDGTLVYFADDKRKKQKGAVRVAIQDVLFAFQLKKASSDHDAKPFVLTMLAATDAERTCWIEALRKVMAASVPPVRLTMMLRSTTLHASTRTLDTGASDVFGMLLEIGKLQQLVHTAKTEWGDDPMQWTSDQYLELCHSIVFTHEQAAGLSLSLLENQVLQEALELRYKYEDAHAARLRLSSAEVDVPPAMSPDEVPVVFEGPVVVETPTKTPAPLQSSGTRKYFEALDPAFVALSPRSKTMAKYAALYQQEALAAKRSWNAYRELDDDLLQVLHAPITTDDLVSALARRFEADRVYTSLGDSLLMVNPAPRLLHHSAGNSIYDEATVLWYRDHDVAVCSPHPFALAKRALASVLDVKEPESIVLMGESGSGKTDFAKHVLKYIATIQQAPKPPTVQLFTSSTKSTIKMRSDEAHLMDLLASKQVQYETIYLDITPERWPEMLAVSHGVKQLPQVHMDRMFFGSYDELQRLEDEEQFVFYVKNPRAARLLSVLLDGNVLLEAFGNASTLHNPNSSRFGKSTAFHVHTTTGHLYGGAITPFFLETSRVTNSSADTFNFHIFYALLLGGSASLLAELRLDAASPLAFAYLGNARSSTIASSVASYDEDRQRWHQVLRCFDLVGVSELDRLAIFRILAAILHLGNLAFDDVLNAQGVAEGVRVADKSALHTIAHLVSLEPAAIEHALCTKRLNVAKASETYELHVHRPHAIKARDSLARLLYDGLFHTLVALLNRSTAPSTDAPKDLCDVTLLDVFGFEDMHVNSFEQLCINYLTEKLAVLHVQFASEAQCALYFAEGLDALWPTHHGSLLVHEGPGMQVMESAVGVWACLEEATLLHGNEQDTKQAKNSRFVRALYLRNAQHEGLRVEQDPLQFTVLHHRSAVTYTATNFVAKNSDALSGELQALVPTSSNAFVKALLTHNTLPVPSASKRQPPSVSSQYRAHVTATLAQLRETKPHFVHCFRARLPSSTDYFDLDKPLLEAQVKGHMLAQVATWASLLFRHHTLLAVFHQRYSMLFPGAIESLQSQVEAFVHDALPHEARGSSFAIGATMIFYSDALHLALHRQRDRLRADACLTIQSAVRMWRAKVRVRAIRQSLRQYLEAITAFYAKYNPAKLPQVPTIVRAFRGREADLLAKLERKYAHARPSTEHEVQDTSLEAFILSVKFDAATVQKAMLLEPKMALFLSEPSILQALREVSLDPSVIYLQTSEPVLRLFYTELRKYLMPAPDPTRVVYQRLPLQDAITLLAQNRLMVPTPTMSEDQSRVIRELAVDPQLLPFHIDEPGIADLLRAFIVAIDGDISDIPEAPELLLVVAGTAPIVEGATPDVAIAAPVVEAPREEVSLETLEPRMSSLPSQRFQDLPLQEAVERLVSAHLLCPTVSMSPDEQAIVLEIAQDPSMLAFHEDDAGVCNLLRSICRLVDDVIASASAPTEPLPVESETTPLEVPLSSTAMMMPPTESPRETVSLLAVAAEPTPASATETNDAPPDVVLKRIKFTQKLMKRVMNDDELMGLMAEPVVTEFFEEFSEDTSKTPTITFPAHETAIIAFYKRLLQLSGVQF